MPKRLLDFRSDNVAGVSPEILEALARVNSGTDASYGDDGWSRELDRRFSSLFEADVKVIPVSTGTAANALALAACARPWGGIYCHSDAHIHTSEGGATEAFTGGAKLITLPGVEGRLTADGLDRALASAERGRRHKPQPDAVSVTQATELGTVYRPDELAAIGEVARRHGVKLHMDGARFSNALVTLGCSPAEATWRAGVDILSFGATKNGCMSTEAIVVFDPGLVENLSYRLRRAGQTWSKMRFMAAQLLAYVEDDLYLRSARHANSLATRFAEGLAGVEGVSLLAKVGANILNLRLSPASIDRLSESSLLFFRRAPDRIRAVCRFDGTTDEVDEAIELIAAAIRPETSVGLQGSGAGAQTK